MKYYAVIDTNDSVSAALKVNSNQDFILRMVNEGFILSLINKQIISKYICALKKLKFPFNYYLSSL